MTDEDAFLRGLLNAPADDVARLVYADWLDERGETTKAEFLRLEAEVETAAKMRRKAIAARLQELAADLETDWLAVVSKLPIERCEQTRARNRYESEREVWAQAPDLARDAGLAPPAAPLLDFLCPLRWENLQATDDPAVRHCTGCDQSVHYCDTIVTARGHAAHGRCVAVDLGIRRRGGDLEPQFELMGMISEEGFKQIERDREIATAIDPVSAKRERAKHDDEPV